MAKKEIFIGTCKHCGCFASVITEDKPSEFGPDLGSDKIIIYCLECPSMMRFKSGTVDEALAEWNYKADLSTVCQELCDHITGIPEYPKEKVDRITLNIIALGGESGELMNVLKKSLWYDKHDKIGAKVNMKKELSHVLFHACVLANELGESVESLLVRSLKDGREKLLNLPSNLKYADEMKGIAEENAAISNEVETPEVIIERAANAGCFNVMLILSGREATELEQRFNYEIVFKHKYHNKSYYDVSW